MAIPDVYLLDTNIVSAVAPASSDRSPEFTLWMHRNSNRLFLSVVTIAEIEGGIVRARREGSHRKATNLADWLDALLHFYAARILPLDTLAARATAALLDFSRTRGHEPDLADMAIAGIAQTWTLTVLTRNPHRFSVIDVPALDPIADMPQAA